MSANSLFELKINALDSSPLAVIILAGPRHECRYANETAKELFAIQDIAKFAIADCYSSLKGEGILAFSAEYLERSGRFLNVAVQTSSGLDLIVNLEIRSLDENGERFLVLSLQDLTRQLKMQRDLQAREQQIRKAFEDLLKQNAQLKELDKAKDRFIGLITHELRTPMSAVMATIDYVHQGFYQSEDELKQLIRSAMEQGAHLAELIDDILDFSKLQAGKTDFYIVQSEISDQVKQATEALRLRAEQAKVRFVIEPTVLSCPACYFDEMRLRQIIDNILSNAIKFNRENGLIQLSAEWTADTVILRISDTGCGIASEDLDRVFDEFETLGQISKHSKGTGLGMPISRRLIEGMGGKIGVKSTLGSGSEFWIEIPTQRVLGDEVYRARPHQDDLLAS